MRRVCVSLSIAFDARKPSLPPSQHMRRGQRERFPRKPRKITGCVCGLSGCCAPDLGRCARLSPACRFRVTGALGRYRFLRFRLTDRGRGRSKECRRVRRHAADCPDNPHTRTRCAAHAISDTHPAQTRTDSTAARLIVRERCRAKRDANGGNFSRGGHCAPAVHPTSREKFVGLAGRPSSPCYRAGVAT